MATEDLVRQKMLRVAPETHARVMQVIAEIQARMKVNTSADIAVRVLLDGWDVMQKGRELNSSGCFEYVVGLAEEKPELVDMLKVVQLSIDHAKKS